MALSRGDKVTDTLTGNIGKIVKYGSRVCKVRIPIFGQRTHIVRQIPTKRLKAR